MTTLVTKFVTTFVTNFVTTIVGYNDCWPVTFVTKIYHKTVTTTTPDVTENPKPIESIVVTTKLLNLATRHLFVVTHLSKT